MIIKQDAAKLKSALANAKWTLLLLSGDEASTAGKVHTFLGGMGLETWRKYFLITDPNGLSQQDRDAWFGGANVDQYVVLGGSVPKQPARAGSITDLLRADSEPSSMKIRSAFAKGDKL
jgi:hypothetical protein